MTKDSSSSSSDGDEQERRRLFFDNRLQQRLQRQADQGSPGYSDEPTATEGELERIRNRDEEREMQFQTRMSTDDWCKCKGCLPVKFAKSIFDVGCCQETQEVRDMCDENLMFGDPKRYECITKHPTFIPFCLYNRGLDNMSHVYYKAGLGARANTRNPNKTRRYTAYRQYTNLVLGRCGYKNRKAIPQCVTKVIRGKFPGDEYTGFEEAEISEEEEDQEHEHHQAPPEH